MGSGIAFSTAVALAAQAAINTAPASLRPITPWNVDYADRLCILQRFYGTRDAPVTLGFKPGLFSDIIRVIIVTKGSATNTVRGVARVSFDGGAEFDARFAEGFIEGRGVRALVMDVNTSELAPLNRAKQIRVKAGKVDLSFALFAVPVAMKALDACQKDLLVKWGMDAKIVASIASFPTQRNGIASIFSTNDYPMSAVRNGEQGTAGVKFWVSKEGKARDCEVVESSGSKVLDQQSCSIIVQRSHFEPARTAAGEPVESIAYQRIRWELPGI